jgi:hypothetical protein
MAQPEAWQHLAEQASKEQDPKKLLALVEELNRVLGEERQTKLAPERIDAGRTTTVRSFRLNPL